MALVICQRLRMIQNWFLCLCPFQSILDFTTLIDRNVEFGRWRQLLPKVVWIQTFCIHNFIIKQNVRFTCHWIRDLNTMSPCIWHTFFYAADTLYILASHILGSVQRCSREEFTDPFSMLDSCVQVTIKVTHILVSETPPCKRQFLSSANKSTPNLSIPSR